MASKSITGEGRERLILEHLPQVRLTARRILGRLPRNAASLEDLTSAGVIGLIAAIDNFDPGCNVKLRTYAEHRIRGAILDALRGMDWAPRQTRRRAKQIEAAIAEAERRFERPPTEAETAAQLTISVEEYRAWLLEVRDLNIASLECVAETQGENMSSELLKRVELERILARTIDCIPPIARTVLSLYYLEELTLREIAQIVKLHASRVSQLKLQAISRLRKHLAAPQLILRGA